MSEFVEIRRKVCASSRKWRVGVGVVEYTLDVGIFSAMYDIAVSTPW